MTNYHFIRLTEELTIATRSIKNFEDKVNGLVVMFDDRSVTFAGDAATAIRGFLNGSIEYPITSNGVLDIPLGWTQRATAQGFGQRTPVNGFPELDLDKGIGESLDGTPPLSVQNPSPRIPGESRINFEAVQKRLKGNLS